MELKYSNSILENVKTYDVYLFGTIGEKIDGNDFAKELIWIDKEADQINLHINSGGGSVFEGMSIVSAINSISAPVTAYVDGVAASMAAVIAVCCQKVVMCDYAKMMIHDPQYSFQGKMSAKQKNQLEKITDMLRHIMSKRGLDTDKVAQLMSAETWMSASEAKELGLIDEVTVCNKTDLQNLTTDELINQINNEYKPKQKTMTKLTAKATELLGITTEAPESEISAAVEKLHNEKLESNKKNVELQAKLDQIEADQKEALKTEAKELVAAAIKDGRLDAKAEKATLEMFEQNPQAAKTMLDSIPPRSSIKAQVGGASVDQVLIDATWDELDKSGKLADLKAKHPDVYAEKFKAKFSSK